MLSRIPLALILAGVPPIAANATSTVVVLPGYTPAAMGFQRQLRALPKRDVVLLFVLSVAGGIFGAYCFWSHRMMQ